MTERLRQLWRERRADAGALAVVAGFFVVFFGWVWTNGVFVVGGDAFAYSLPLRAFGWGEIARGALPLWTPHVMSGYPLLAMSQLAFGYPLTWGYLFLSPHAAEQVYVLAPFLLAPAFTYAYARQTGRSRLAALFAGLSFGYGGAMTNLLGVVGIMTNSVMWLPLVLVGIERARTRRFAPSLLVAAFAYAMSVLTGLGQGFVIVGLVAGAYALFLALFDAPRGAGVWARWRPLAVCAAAGAIGLGVGAFQILETLRAVRRSVRGTLSYDLFIAGSFPPRVAFGSLVAPLYTERFADVSTYVAPLALALAAAAVVAAVVRRGAARDRRVFFWLAVALIAFLFVFGNQTFIYPLLYRVPVFNLFRVPSRHAFEWTFAVSVLAAYGWDALSELFARRRGDLPAHAGDMENAAAAESSAAATAEAVPPGARGWIDTTTDAILLIASVVVGLLWLRATGAGGPFGFRARAGEPAAWASGLWYAGLPVSSYLVWKAAFTLLTGLLLWRAWATRAPRARALLLASAALAVCFVEPFVAVKNWWPTFAKPPARFSRAAPATDWMRANTAGLERVYTRFDLFADEFEAEPRVDPPNLTALAGLHNVAGYEPLIAQRYSRALGGVGLDTVYTLPGAAPSVSLFDERSRVLDLLGARFVCLRERRAPSALTEGAEKGGVRFGAGELIAPLGPGQSVVLAGAGAEVDGLGLVTTLSNSAGVEQGATVARARVITSDGRDVELFLRAGQDTAEWAHERSDVRPSIRHALAPVFDSSPAQEGAETFPALRYWTRLPLGGRARVEMVEITNTSTQQMLALWKAALHDSAAAASYPLARSQSDLSLQTSPGRWRRAFERDDVFVYENARAQPRAWLVAEAESVDGEEALRRISGAGASGFDPQRTALLEVAPPEMPQLPGGDVATGASARVVGYEPRRLTIETESGTPALLVVGEIFHPGWEATVDGRGARIHLTDFLLQSVHVPAGRHRIELRYRATAARNGAVISALSLGCLLTLALLSRRSRGRRAAATRG